MAKVEYTLSVVLNAVNDVLAIKKIKPDWQAEKWNLPGGHMELTDVSPIEAAKRELREETGLYEPDNPYFPSRIMGTVEGNNYKMYVVWHYDTRGPLNHRTDVGEQITWMPLHQMVQEGCIPNLKIILPLIMKGVSGWTLRGEKGETKWGIEL